MSAVYLAFHQGVTVPLKEKGKVEAYKFLRHKADHIHSLVPLTGMHKDQDIKLTASGLGQDYQASTVAYYRYDRDSLPSDEQLLADLHNVVDNYKQYVELSTSASNTEPEPDPNPIPVEEQPEVDPISIPEQIQAIKPIFGIKAFIIPTT